MFELATSDFYLTRGSNISLYKMLSTVFSKSAEKIKKSPGHISELLEYFQQKKEEKKSVKVLQNFSAQLFYRIPPGDYF